MNTKSFTKYINDNALIIIVIIIVIFMIYHQYNYKEQENLTSNGDLSYTVVNSIAIKVFHFINKLPDNSQFVDYVNYLNSIDNLNLNLISLEAYYELKTLKKQNKLTVQSVIDIMSQKPPTTTIKPI